MKNLPEPESRTIQLMPVVFQEEPSPRAPAFREADEPNPYRLGEGSPKNQVRVRQMSVKFRNHLTSILSKLPTASPDLVFYGQRHRLGS